jgi:hypothetical protein
MTEMLPALSTLEKPIGAEDTTKLPEPSFILFTFNDGAEPAGSDMLPAVPALKTANGAEVRGAPDTAGCV